MRRDVPNSVNVIRTGQPGDVGYTIERWDYSAEHSAFQHIESPVLQLESSPDVSADGGAGTMTRNAPGGVR